MFLEEIIITLNIKIKKNNIYRIRFLSFQKGKKKEYLIEDIPLNYFKLPKELTEKEAYLIISHIKDVVNDEYPKKLTDYQKAILIDALLSTYGFEILNENQVPEKNIIDLYIISGSIKRLKKSEYYQKYINWYTPNITYSDVAIIKKNSEKRKIKRKGQ